MKTIEIIVDRQGNSRLQTKGFAGSSCKDASAELEKALGQIAEEKLTAEFYQSASQQIQSHHAGE